MVRLRTSLAWGLGAACVVSVAVHGCGGADERPQDRIDPAGGTGGIDASDSSGGSGGGGGLFVDGFSPDVRCTDPNDLTDTDGDLIADQIENPEGVGQDTDGDGTLDKDDDDSDGDGIPDSVEAGPGRQNPCDDLADTDRDGRPDFLDADSDDDGVLDGDEPVCGSTLCRLVQDCDSSGFTDLVELAAAGDPCDGAAPANAELYFVVPYEHPDQAQRFPFSTGIKEADIYFLIDTTVSMQPALDNMKESLNRDIIPTILNGDPTANPPIPAIPGAHIGVGTFQDVPWLPWGEQGDFVYRDRFVVGATEVRGFVSPPKDLGGTFAASDNVTSIIDSLTASQGGDAPESTTQALYLAATNQTYRVFSGPGGWPPLETDGTFNGARWLQQCDASGRVGRACFRPGKLPIFVIITDAGFHNGPTSAFDYIVPPNKPPGDAYPVEGAKTYNEVLSALNAIGAKTVGVSVNTGSAGQAQADLRDLARQTGSVYVKYQFGESVELPLVTEQDTSTGSVSNEVVRLIGLLAGQGLNNVTTVRENYSCAGGIDCDGDFAPDAAYENLQVDGAPFDATKLIVAVRPVPVSSTPKPYKNIDETTFFGVRGDATVEFEVIARNHILQPRQLTVVRALLKVQTPTGQALGGTEGVKNVFFVIPPADPLVQ